MCQGEEREDVMLLLFDSMIVLCVYALLYQMLVLLLILNTLKDIKEVLMRDATSLMI